MKNTQSKSTTFIILLLVQAWLPRLSMFHSLSVAGIATVVILKYQMYLFGMKSWEKDEMSLGCHGKSPWIVMSVASQTYGQGTQFRGRIRLTTLSCCGL